MVVAGCSTASVPMGKPLPNLSYTHLTPYTPYGGSVMVRQSAEVSAETKANMQGMVKPLDDLINRYATGRFLTTIEAPQQPVKSVFDVVKLSLSKKSDADNMMGILSGAAAEHYTLDLLIHIYPVLHDGTLWQPYTIKIKREFLIPDNLSLAEREFRQFEFLEKVINDIDKTLAKFIPNMR